MRTVRPTHSERIAVLETEMQIVRTSVETLLEKQVALLLKLERYDGKFGAVLLALSAVGTALLFFKDSILSKLGLKW